MFKGQGSKIVNSSSNDGWKSVAKTLLPSEQWQIQESADNFLGFSDNIVDS